MEFLEKRLRSMDTETQPAVFYRIIKIRCLSMIRIADSFITNVSCSRWAQDIRSCCTACFLKVAARSRLSVLSDAAPPE